MRKILPPFLFLILSVSNAFAQLSTQEIYEKLSFRSYTVYAENENSKSSGTAVRVDSMRVITNYHVISRASHIEIRNKEGDTFSVDSIRIHPSRDLAVLYSFKKNTEPLSTALPHIGEDIVIIGSPLDYQNLISRGIISGKFEYYDIITAPLSVGNSGSPVYNTNGQLVGIATSSDDRGYNINFSTPSQEIDLIEQRQSLKVPISNSEWENVVNLQSELQWGAETEYARHMIEKIQGKQIIEEKKGIHSTGKPMTTFLYEGEIPFELDYLTIFSLSFVQDRFTTLDVAILTVSAEATDSLFQSVTESFTRNFEEPRVIDGTYFYKKRNFHFFISKMSVEGSGSILIRKTNRDILAEIANSDAHE